MEELTIIYEEIDNYKIIVGSGQLSIDPVYSQEKSASELRRIKSENFKDFPELLQRENLIKQQAEYSEKAKKAGNSAKQLIIQYANAIKNKDFFSADKYQSQIEKLNDQYKNYQSSVLAINNQLAELKLVIEPKIRQIRKNNICYCEPRKNELIDAETADLIMSKSTEDMSAVIIPGGKTVDHLIQLHLSKSENEQISIDGEKVDDFRGKNWHYKDENGKWKQTEVCSRLGMKQSDFVPKGSLKNSILNSDLSSDQREEIRVENLSDEDRIKEFNLKSDEVLEKAAIMKNKLQIKGESSESAISQSQSFYQSEVEKLKTKYGV